MPNETRRILLINSDNGIKEMMELAIETTSNCEVITVSSGIEAIERASAEQINAILLDLDEMLPDLSWSEIIKDLKKNPLTDCIPLILLTSTPQSQKIIEFQQAREIKAVAKSFDLLNLASRISTLLEWN